MDVIRTRWEAREGARRQSSRVARASLACDAACLASWPLHVMDNGGFEKVVDKFYCAVFGIFDARWMEGDLTKIFQ